MKRKIGAIIVVCLIMLGALGLAAYGSGVAISQTFAGITTDLSHPATYLADGKADTYWCLRADATQGWAQLTLAKPILIYGLKLTGSLGADTTLTVEYQSGGAWLPFTAATVTNLPADGRIDLSWDRVVTQTIRIRLSSNSFASGYLSEVEVLGETAGSILHRLQPERITTGTGTFPNAPVCFLNDGNTYTGWQLLDSATQGTAVFAFPTESTLKNINLYFNSAFSGNIQFEAFINNNWEKITNVSNQPAGWFRLNLNSNTIATAKVRLTLSGCSGNTALSEVEFWGCGSFSGDTRQTIGVQEAVAIAPSTNTTNTTITDGGIKVLYRSVNTSAITNSLQHDLKLYNMGSTELNLADVKLRYWYTNETVKQQVAHINSASIDVQNVITQFVTVADRANANTYLEIGFSAAAGTLAPGGYVEIKLGLNAGDWTCYNQPNDFSFSANTTYTENTKYTGYLNNTRAWGKEPDSTIDTAVNLQFTRPNSAVFGNQAADGRLKVLSQSSDTAMITNSLQTNLKFENTSGAPLDLSKVKLRYWYTNDTQKQQVANIYWASCGTANVKAGFGTVASASVTADTYLELGFTGGTLEPGATVAVKLGLNTDDRANYKQTNDYSFNGVSSAYGENSQVTGYIDNKLAWGIEPDTRPVFDNISYRLELAFTGRLTEDAIVEVNNTQLELQPALTLNDRTIYCGQLTAAQLWEGVNYLRIKPFTTAATLENAFLTRHDPDGQCPVALEGLSDGLLLSAAASTATEWQFDQPILIEEATVTTTDNSATRIYAFVNDNWTELTNWQNLDWGTRFTGPVTTNKLKLEAAGSVGELIIKGSMITDQAPAVKIFWPHSGDAVSLQGWANQEVIGLVDNPQTTVNVNGADVALEGHCFTLPLSKVTAANGETVTITATAKDTANRTGSASVAVTAGEYSEVTLDQADTLFYTPASNFTISGTANNQSAQYQVNVAGTSAPINGNRFVTSVFLKEGLNLIEVQAIKNGQLVKTFYRRVVRNSAPVGVTIQAPADGAYLNVKTIKVTGSITGLAPLKVSVNGVAATVGANNYFATVALTEGSNKITVVTQDANGKKTTKTITVCRDTKAPVISDASPITGQFIASTTITAKAKISDANSFWVTINGQAITDNAGIYKTILNLADGAQTITITAQDVAGNTTTYSANTIIDTVPPEAFTPVADATGWSNNNKPTITFSTTDATSGIDHYEIAVNEGSWKTAVVSPCQFADALADGELIIQVKAVDKAGNVTIGKVKVSIDTVPPGVPANFRPVPGNAKMILKWDKPSEDTVKYQIERVLYDTDTQFAAAENIYTDSEVENGVSIKYRVWAIDRAGNVGPSTDWQTAKVGLAEVSYQPGQGAVVEYENVVLCLPDTGVPKDVAKVEVTEIQSEHLTNQAIYPVISPIYEFSTVKAGETKPQESTIFEKGYLAKIEYDPTKLPEGFLEENLGVYYYNPMFDRWFLVKGLGVDKEHHAIYFITNHFSSFSIQATVFQELGADEYKDAGYSPLKSYSQSEGIAVSPQGGTASTKATELVLPGRDGFDLVLSRHYDSAIARSDALSLAIGGSYGFKVIPSSTNGPSSMGDLKGITDFFKNIQKATKWADSPLFQNVKNILDKLLYNQGDYAYSMGAGWRLNLPYVKAANSDMIFVTPDGAMHSLFELEFTQGNGYAEGDNTYRTLTFKQHEGDDFTITVKQIDNAAVDVFSIATKDRFLRSGWYSLEYRVTMKDGTVYLLNGAGRVTKITDPSGKNEISFDYHGPLLDHLTDSMGRVVKFDYDNSVIIPRIKKIWVENDAYNREVHYDLHGLGLLRQATDVNGRVSEYDYDFKMLLDGSASCKVNFLKMVAKVVLNAVSYGTLGGLLGNDIVLSGNVQVEAVYLMDRMTAPGQGKIEIDYDTKTLLYGDTELLYFKLFGIKIPEAIKFNGHMFQRILTDRVDVYAYSGGPLVRSTGYDYDIRHHSHGQPFVETTVENDGRQKKIYHYISVSKDRYNWTNNFGVGPFRLEQIVLRSDILPLNTSTEVRDAATGYLYETMETEYDTDRMSPKQQVTKRGSNSNKVTYTYDDWGNVIYTEDSSSVGDRVNRTKTWSYYLGVSGPASEAPWLTTPYSQVGLSQNRYNLPVGKIVANYATTAEGESITYLHTYNQYNALGQLISNAQWDGKEWLKIQYEYHPTFGSITKKIDAQNHETEYQYDQYGLPKATIEKSVSNAKGETSDITTRTGYDYSSGWKLWQQNPNGFVTQYEYDALGRTTKIIAPDDDAGEKGWNPAQGPIDRTNNPITRIQYDDRELSSLVTDAKGAQIKYNFDKFGRLEKITKNYYDQNTQRARQAMTTLGYDAWGNINSIIDPNGNDQSPAYKYTTWYTYDAMGRNTAIIYPDATASQDDNPRKTLDFNYSSNILTTTDENGRKTVEQEDLQGKVIRQTKTVNGDDTWVTTHYFDGLGNEVETILETPARTSQTKKTYNQLNLLARVDSPAEQFWVNNQETTLTPYQRFEYNKVGQKIADIIGTSVGERTTAYQPDELGRIVKTTVTYTDNGQAKQAITETYYDADGNKVKVVDANNTPLPEAERKASIYTYTATDLLATETDPAGNTTSYTYDKAGNRLSMTDPRGNSGKYSGDFTIVYDYDDLNRLVAGHLPKCDGQTEKPLVKLVYDLRGNLLQRVEPDGMVSSYTYAPRNRVETETRSGDNKSYVIGHHYDAVGNETQTKDARGYVTIKDYDELNRLVKVTYPEQEGKVAEQYSYDEFNNRISFVNGRFVKTVYNYDRYNRLREVTDALGGKTSYHYDTWGNLVQMENALGHVTRYQYDELNRLLQETDPQGFNKLYRYDAVGNRVWSQDPNGTASVYEYAPNQLLKQVTLTNGTATQRLGYSYDEAGYRTEVRNDNVVTKYNMASGSYIPDPFGRIHQESKTFGGKTYAVGYSYDVMGRVTGVKYPTGHAVEYNYNNLGELKNVPGYIDEAPSYDQGGLLVGLKAANGVTTSLAYDKNGRLKNLKYANQAAVLKEYAYTFDGANNIKTKNSDNYEYDVLNQLLYANLKGSFEVRPELGEEKIGLTKEDYGGRNSLEFTVAALDVIELDYASGSVGVDLLAPIPVTRIELNPNSITHRVTVGNLRVYTSNDNSTYTKVEGWQLKKQEKGVLEIVLAQPVTTRYIKVRCLYDERDKQLAKIDQAQFSNTAEQIVKVHYIVNTQIEQYNYDKLGNRINDTLTQRYTSTRQYTYYPNSSRLKSNEKYNFEYDANGNLIKKTTANGDTVWTYQYDLLNRLTQVAKNGVTVAGYLYDELGLRVNKTGTSGTTAYIFDTGGNVLYEQEGHDYLEYIYVLGKHFARVDGNLDNSTLKKYFYHTDHLGSTVAVTDETGKQVWSAEYTPFGKQVSQDGKLDHAAKFTGKDLDEDTELYYFNARWYDQEVGRFVEEDPIQDDIIKYFRHLSNPKMYKESVAFGIRHYSGVLGLDVDDAVRQFDGIYTYCLNNPLVYIDPSGLYTGWGHSFLTRQAAEATGITDPKTVSQLVRYNTITDSRSTDREGKPTGISIGALVLEEAPSYHTGDHFNTNPKGQKDSRDERVEVLFEAAVMTYKNNNTKEANDHLGEMLHAIEDKYAHSEQNSGQDWGNHKLSDLKGQSPDNPYRLDDTRSSYKAKQAFYNAYVESCQKLNEYNKAIGKDSYIEIKDRKTFFKEYNDYVIKNSKGKKEKIY